MRIPPALLSHAQVGDVLYMPRGTIHHAVAGIQGSSHLTLSTYQHWTWGELAQRVLQVGHGKCRIALPCACDATNLQYRRCIWFVTSVATSIPAPTPLSRAGPVGASPKPHPPAASLAPLQVASASQHEGEGVTSLPLALRQGLPHGFLRDCGLTADIMAGPGGWHRGSTVATSAIPGRSREVG